MGKHEKKPKRRNLTLTEILSVLTPLVQILYYAYTIAKDIFKDT